MTALRGAQITSVVLLAVVAAACGKLEPLKAPIAADKAVAGGLHVVVSNADLGQLSDAIRLAAGKTVEAPVAPFVVPATDGRALGAATVELAIASGKASLGAAGRLRFTYAITASPIDLTVSQTGAGACTIQRNGLTGTLTMSLRVARGPGGNAEVMLGDATECVLSPAPLIDDSGCLAKAPSGSFAAITKHVDAAIRQGLVGRYVSAARSSIAAVIPLGLERKGRWTTSISGRNVELRVASSFSAGTSKPGDEATVVAHNGQYASASLNVALDADRHPCAVDGPAPGLKSAPLTLATPPSPAGSFLLRRAVVVDRALLAHVAWTAQRTGLFCRHVELPGGAGLTGQWAARVLPALGAWIKDAPQRVRFWPGQLAKVAITERNNEAAIRLDLPSAELEITAPISGIEAVALKVTGSFRLVLQPANDPKTGVGLAIVDASVNSAVVHSPLADQAPVAANDALADVVKKVVARAFFGAFSAWPVPGFDKASVVGSSRVGDRMWIWLEEAPPDSG